jgi:glycerol-3-phosphate dehydrogenase subunit C
MTAAGDPHDPSYTDEATVRGELTRAFELCVGCRRCTSLCGVFPTLFGLVDRIADHDPGRLTPSEQDAVLDGCFHCGRCAIGCPYAPGIHEAALDLPRLLRRAEAMRHAAGHQPIRRRLADRVIVRGVLTGRSLAAPPGSVVRRVVAATAGVSAVRVLPPVARQRFSTWFARRDPQVAEPPRGRVLVFPSCLVEHRDVETGRDLVTVYEHNGVECSVSRAGCCGAPWRDAGDRRRFDRALAATVTRLATEMRSAEVEAVVVPQPTCAAVLRDAVDHVVPAVRRDAELVGRRTHDAADHLLAMHDDGTLDTRFDGAVPARVVQHLPCHRLGAKRPDAVVRLLALTGTVVEVVEGCAAVGTTWGFRTANEEQSVAMARDLARQLIAARGVGGGPDEATVVGECGFADAALAAHLERRPTHPVSVLARAYGIAPG